MNLRVDDTTERLVGMLDEVMEQEPAPPDPDNLDGHALAEASMKHYEWERHVAALRLLVGVRMTNLALDQIGEEG